MDHKSGVDFLVFTQANKLLQFTMETKETSDFFESVSLVGTKIFGLFSDTQLPVLFSHLFSVETSIDTCKREIVFLTKSLDSIDLLTYVDTISPEVMSAIGPDFFFITTKRLSKNQSIETYAKFLFVLLKGLGYHSSFIKNFFFNDRDADEVEVLLKYISNFSQEKLRDPISFIIIKTLIIAIQKLSTKHRVPELFPLVLNRKVLFMNMDITEINKSLSKVFTSFVQSALVHNDYVNFKKIIDFFQSIRFENNEVVCNRVLESLNRNVVDDSIIEYFLNYMRENNITPNIVSYNTVMDYYCNNQKIEKALEIYESLKKSTMKLDNYTFTILIKGMKAMKDFQISTIEHIFNEYIELNEVRDIVIYNNFMDAFVYLGFIDKARAIYEKMLEDSTVKPDQVTFNTLIKGSCKNKELEPAIRYLEHMKKFEIKPNRITYNSLMDIAIKLQDMKHALDFLEEMRRDDITPDGYTYSIILNGLKINNSDPAIVKATMDNISKVIACQEFRLDEVFFNSLLDVCSKYDFYDLMKHYYQMMKDQKIHESAVTFGILIKAYGKVNDFDSAQLIFERMMMSNMPINEVTYGCILDACSKSGKMDVAMKIFESLKNSTANMNSIVFTTIIKGFINSEGYPQAIQFFQTVRTLTDLPGMIITYNCMLDLYVRKNDMVSAEALFKEIEKFFKADLISYSTMIKGLCTSNRKEEGFGFIKKMLSANIDVDVSVVNLYLDSCSNLNDFKIGIQAYTYVMMKNIIPNEITFGIMIKIYGFSRELQKAFDLLDLMEVHQIRPSIIIFTNLIHISFYNKQPKKSEIAFLQFKKLGNIGDRLMYSKLIEGLIKFKETSKLMKYVEMAIEDSCTLKTEVIAQLEEIFADDAEDMELIKTIKELKYVEKNTYNNTDRFKNKVSNQNTLKFKQQMHDKAKEMRDKVDFNQEPPKQRREGLSMIDGKSAVTEKKPLFKEREVKEFTKSEHKSEYSKKESIKKPATLFNFRQNSKKDGC